MYISNESEQDDAYVGTIVVINPTTTRILRAILWVMLDGLARMPIADLGYSRILIPSVCGSLKPPKENFKAQMQDHVI